MASSRIASLPRRLHQLLASSRFAAASLLLHLLLVITVGTRVIIQEVTHADDFEATGGDGLVKAETAAPGPPPQSEPQATAQETVPVTPPVPTAPVMEVLTTVAVAPTSVPVAAPVMPSVSKAPAAKAMPASLNTTGQGGGMGGLPSTMQGRAGGTSRMVAMKKMGGKEKSEKAVLAGLRWLKAHQSLEGSWSEEETAAMTGLALLCFLGHGETPASPEFGYTVQKGVNWLLVKGTETQGRLSMEPRFIGTSAVYAHAICAYALGEYYTMTRDERVRPLLTQAIGYIVKGQHQNGAWDYGYAKGDRSDTSVSGWQIQALKAAHLTGLKLEGVDPALDRAMLWLKECQADNGAFGYTGKGDARYSMTGVGVLCSYFWTAKKDRVVTEGVRYILDETEKDFPVLYKHPRADLYAWYYHTQACLMVGGLAWSKWNRWFQDEIGNAQEKDGSWPPVGRPGSPGNFEVKTTGAGPFYRTALCVLMLEVFYRYMPTTKA